MSVLPGMISIIPHRLIKYLFYCRIITREPFDDVVPRKHKLRITCIRLGTPRIFSLRHIIPLSFHQSFMFGDTKT